MFRYTIRQILLRRNLELVYSYILQNPPGRAKEKVDWGRGQVWPGATVLA
jgi:hypothetical protein